MGNEKIVIVSVLVPVILAAVVFSSAQDIEQSEPIRPPSMLMEVDGEVVQGLEGDFCWTVENKTACVDKLDPDQLSTRLAVIAEDVDRNTTYRFYPLNHTRPDSLTVSVRDDEGNVLSEHQYRRGGLRLSLEPGTYLIISRSVWPQGNVSHVFQVRIGGIIEGIEARNIT